MSPTRNSEFTPWPKQTPPPTLPPDHFFSTSDMDGRSVKRRKVALDGFEAKRDGSLSARQVIVDQDLIETAKINCQYYSGNEVISCFPTSSTVVPQHQWATFVWNSRRPELTQIDLVDIFLFRADSRQEILRFTRVPNPSGQAGVVTAQVDDRWFGSSGENYVEGQNVSYPFYWVIIRSDKTLDGNEIPQPAFTAVQTTVLDSVATSRSIASVASASSASLASAASVASVLSLSGTPRVTTINGTPTTLFPSSSNYIQSPSSGDSFPRWAIAVIVVLGFFAIAATGILIFFVLRRIRRRNQAEVESNRHSMGSASPMMANAQQDSPLISPVLATGPRAGSLRRNDSHGGHGAPSFDAESSISGEGGPFSGQDAAIMADAFRKMLRKPDFAAIGEGEHPESQGETEVLNRELAEEGRDLRSVSSSRGVRVDSHSDHGDDLRR